MFERRKKKKKKGAVAMSAAEITVGRLGGVCAVELASQEFSSGGSCYTLSRMLRGQSVLCWSVALWYARHECHNDTPRAWRAVCMLLASWLVWGDERCSLSDLAKKKTVWDVLLSSSWSGGEWFNWVSCCCDVMEGMVIEDDQVREEAKKKLFSLCDALVECVVLKKKTEEEKEDDEKIRQRIRLRSCYSMMSCTDNSRYMIQCLAAWADEEEKNSRAEQWCLQEMERKLRAGNQDWELEVLKKLLQEKERRLKEPDIPNTHDESSPQTPHASLPPHPHFIPLPDL